ncbi:MAG: hypothetical protein E7317_10890 [Clostridiales bacterium]|nr:hypothetical protein [Clostridiales bacterium]
MTKLWVRIIKKHRISKQDTVPCAFGEEEEVLREVCRDMDIPAPLWLGKQQREFAEFRRTAFLHENFMEDVWFDRLEIEFIDEEAKGRRSRDPRNQFDGY